MNFNIRAAIIDNLQHNSEDDLKRTIEDAIAANDEKYLPGLGVIFELIWHECSTKERGQLVHDLAQHLANVAVSPK